MASKVYDHCFGSQFAVHYSKGRVQAVSDIYSAELSDCHIQILEQFQVRANLIVPVLKGAELWGLLCIHQCSQPRRWTLTEIGFVQKIANHFALALQQAEFIARIQSQADALKESQLKIIQSEKMASLGQLVAGVAHEINNPVNFIYGNLPHVNDHIGDLLELAREIQKIDLNSPSDIRSLQHKIQDLDLGFVSEDLPKILASLKLGTDRIRQIVVSLRNFSRLDEAEFKPVDLHEGIDSTLLILSNRLKFRDSATCIDVVKNYGQIPPVECFPAQVNQVFMNLLSNAIDAIEEAIISSGLASDRGEAIESGAKIWIDTRMDGIDWVEIRIRDSGNGVSDDVKDKLFDHFFTTKPIGKGTGLGLSISYEIIRQKHGGDIHFKALPEGGTEFTIRLPVRFRQSGVISVGKEPNSSKTMSSASSRLKLASPEQP